ncbi:hypothetical protein L1987_48759 [Smallanthus sonchifolius]|uniref:Uncharacterized protein n=1 Tax=Smallanthus sonchifolius TaxID=185202 RepID=A0ACB9FSU5_9ASTR|nr:hypothetical protein L1987_48759 [Smallanthus sonchifolius]
MSPSYRIVFHVQIHAMHGKNPNHVTRRQMRRVPMYARHATTLAEHAIVNAHVHLVLYRLRRLCFPCRQNPRRLSPLTATIVHHRAPLPSSHATAVSPWLPPWFLTQPLTTVVSIENTPTTLTVLLFPFHEDAALHCRLHLHFTDVVVSCHP